MNKKRILIIDDEASQRELLSMLFSRKGYSVTCASRGDDGLKEHERSVPDVVILDIRLPDRNGLEVLGELRRNNPGTAIIMITAYHDVETTVRAMKLGACDYITKPIDVDEIEKAVSRAFRLATTDGPKTSPIEQDLQKGPIIGRSKAMKEIFKSIGMLCENRVTVLIEGETGTGKELIAKAIHCFGLDADHPFLAINCSALVESLLESELFGHEKGAFTGAVSRKKGKFELAGEGTIFLDEVGEIPFEIQAKLLRFLQEREFQRIGGEKTLKANARVIAATNRDLWRMVKEGAFREDLYYRLSVARVHVPPLRERKEDLLCLIDHLLKKVNLEVAKDIKSVEERGMLRLLEYEWPGNVRQLENVLTRAAIATRGEVLLEEALIPFLGKEAVQAETPGQNRLSLHEVEKDHILKILASTNWHITKSAQILGISRPTLRTKIKEYNLLPKH
ncbi:MAG: sigma-54 dependent transcriptional regulator [Syntrophorhabdales bacterium]|jgi:two-component system response regulator AtoC